MILRFTPWPDTNFAKQSYSLAQLEVKSFITLCYCSVKLASLDTPQSRSMLSVGTMDDPDTARLKEKVLAAQVEAALQGHNLGEIEQVQEEEHQLGYEAHCKKCGKSV